MQKALLLFVCLVSVLASACAGSNTRDPNKIKTRSLELVFPKTLKIQPEYTLKSVDTDIHFAYNVTKAGSLVKSIDEMKDQYGSRFG